MMPVAELTGVPAETRQRTSTAEETRLAESRARAAHWKR